MISVAIVLALAANGSVGHDVASSTPIWPSVTVKDVQSARRNRCGKTRKHEVQSVLRHLTTGDFSNWRNPCLCVSKPLQAVLRPADEASAPNARRALYIVLERPVAVPAPGSGSRPHAPTSSLVIVRDLRSRGTMVFIGRPAPPRVEKATGASTVYDGWLLNGDPFRRVTDSCW